MNNQIYFSTNRPQNIGRPPEQFKKGSNFKDILSASLELNTPANNTAAVPASSSPEGGVDSPVELMTIGTTSASQPTVSHVLSNNAELKGQKWNIIFSDINKQKSYTTVPVGSTVYYNRISGELSWTSSGSNEETARSVPDTPVARVSLGSIDKEHPTVSHLLTSSQEYGSDTWDILSASSNSVKDFRSIPTNTEIWLDKQTHELSWDTSSSTASPAGDDTGSVAAATGNEATIPGAAMLAPDTSRQPEIIRATAFKEKFTVSTETEIPVTGEGETAGMPPDLTEAVKPFIGRPYKEIDCYGLVINGLKKMGLPYSGEGGLRNRLTSMAREKGLPANAYLTGEGIVQATGTQIFKHTSIEITNWTAEAEQTFEDMKHLLQKGQILSFSTPTRGHTGIISQHNDQWTFINSGRMDNHIAQANRSREVGEEDLADEVQNWFKLAKKNREPLFVSLGQIEEDKIRTTIQPSFQLSQRI